ncbi:TonB-dependent receptor [Parabacteroides sp. OttesenSCG-928-J18]|nr:TonB-dependent receptor [Parabacteroides sp. OttesenSCG-928-J18]
MSLQHSTSKRKLLKRYFVVVLFSLMPLISFAQITMQGNKIPLSKAFSLIEQSSEYRFFYSNNLRGVDKEVTFNFSNASIGEAMNKLLESSNLSYQVGNDKVVTVTEKLPQQSVAEIKGTVVDEEGEPLIGANVFVPGTTIGVITEVDGSFVLRNVPASQKTLTFSYIGMEELTVNIKPTMHVVLRTDSKLLDEVVVVAFGEQKKAAFTGSAGVIRSDMISKRQTSNAMDALNGQIAGVQLTSASGAPNATPSIRVRGFSSINAENNPLIILDGMPYEGGINNINPSDIESITVQKDAASNALYGARGANGVIMITTKKASINETVVTFDAKLGINERVNNLYEYITDPGEYYETHYRGLYNYYRNVGGNSIAEAYKRANETLGSPIGAGGLGYMVYNVPVGQYLIGQNGKLNPNATLGNKVTYDGQEYLLTPDDWVDEAFRTSLRQEYNVNVNGGNSKTQFYGSFGYLNDEGIVYASDYTRYTARLRASHQAKSWLRFGGNISYSHYKSNGVASGDGTSVFDHAVSVAPIYPLYVRDGNGNIMTDKNGKIYDYGKGNNAGLSRAVLPNTNPLQTNLLNRSMSNGNTTNAQGFAEVRFLKDFKFTFNAGISNNEYRSVSTSNPYYGFSANLDGKSTISHYRTFTYNLQQLLNYSKSLGDHTISALLGHENYVYNYSMLSGSRTQMAYYDGIYELGSAITKDDQNSSSTDYNTEGYFTQLQYDYKMKYFGSISYRRDASSRFHSDNWWGNFWSVGGAWILSEEDWFTTSWVDMLKVKLSYGSQGNDNIGNFRYTDTYTPKDSNGNLGFAFSSKGNKDITWETNANLNIGVEFSLFKDRLSGNVDVFRRKTTDMLFSLPTPLSLGYSSYYSNVGDMINQGVELDLRGKIIKQRNFSWEINFNTTHYKNEVTMLSDIRATEMVDGYKGYTSGNYYLGEGLSMYTWRIKKFAGINEEGLPTWYQTDEETGERTTTAAYAAATYYLADNAIPDLYGGFGTTLSAYGFDLSANFSYQIGGQYYDGGYAGAMAVPGLSGGGYNIHKDILKAWTPENPSSTIPRWQIADTNINARSDLYLTDASWLNLQNVTLGYTVPRTWLRKAHLKSLRIYVTADNLFFVSKRKGFDPRSSFSGSTSSTGYSQRRTISTGINLQF